MLCEYEEAVCEIIFLLLFSGMWFLACRLGVKEGREAKMNRFN